MPCSAFNCFLVLRGLATLSARMRVHSENALAVAKFLSTHPAVATINYPGGYQLHAPGSHPPTHRAPLSVMVAMVNSMD